MFTPAVLRRAALIETISWTLLLLAGLLWLVTKWTVGPWIMIPVDSVIWTSFAIIAGVVTSRSGWPLSRYIWILAVSLIPIRGYFMIRDEIIRLSKATFTP